MKTDLLAAYLQHRQLSLAVLISATGLPASVLTVSEASEDTLSAAGRLLGVSVQLLQDQVVAWQAERSATEAHVAAVHTAHVAAEAHAVAEAQAAAHVAQVAATEAQAAAEAMQEIADAARLEAQQITEDTGDEVVGDNDSDPIIEVTTNETPADPVTVQPAVTRRSKKPKG